LQISLAYAISDIIIVNMPHLDLNDTIEI